MGGILLLPAGTAPRAASRINVSGGSEANSWSTSLAGGSAIVKTGPVGVGLGDFNLDGHLDIFKTHFADDTNVLYRNDGKGNFDDVTISSGLAVETRYIGWGATIADFDNNGLPDLFAVTGNVYPEIERKLPAYPWKTPRLVFRNLGTRFEELFDEAGPAISEPHASRSAPSRGLRWPSDWI